MSYLDMYRKKQNVIGNDRISRSYNRQLQEFNLFLKETPTKHPCVIDGVNAEAVFQDHSQSNNKDLSDDKYMVVSNDVEVGVGSYVEWRDAEWMVFTEEYKTIPTHQQLKIKHVNRYLKWLVDKDKKIICNDGQGWPAYVQNQTLYTLGVSFSGPNIALANAKMSIYVKDVPETRAVSVGTRLWVAGQVYKVEFADFVSRPGLINWLLDEDTKNPEIDNFDLEIADYWGSGDKRDIKKGQNDSNITDSSDSSSDDVQPNVEWQIEGEQKARLGHSYVYTVKSDDGSALKVEEWIIGDPDEMPFYVLEKDDQSISVRVKDIYKLVGQTATIAAKVNGEIKNIAIKIIKKF